MVSNHAKDSQSKIRLVKSTKHQKISDDSSCTSSIDLNVSLALRVLVPNLPQKNPTAPHITTKTTENNSAPQKSPNPREKTQRRQATTTSVSQTKKQRTYLPNKVSNESVESTLTFHPSMSTGIFATQTAPKSQEVATSK